MVKILVSFLAGAVAMTSCVVWADGRAAMMFFAGAALVLAGQAAVLCRPARIAKTGQLLIRIAETLSSPRAGRRVVMTSAEPAGSSDERSPSPAAELVDHRVIDIAEALRGMGARKKTAYAIAGQAIATGGDFDQMLRRAIDLSQTA